LSTNLRKELTEAAYKPKTIVDSPSSTQKQEELMRLPAQNFQDLIVWQKAHQFVLGVYRVSKGFPREEIYGLTSQFRRAAISVAANIAEGFKKRGRLDKVRFMNIAEGSLEECRYYLILVHDLSYADPSDLFGQLNEVSKLLFSYSTAIRSSIS
jgi:four helix bundle protein